MNWEKIYPEANYGFEIKLCWYMKPSQADQTGERNQSKTFVKDDKEGALSLVASIWNMLGLRQKPNEGEEESTPVFSESDGRETTVAEYRKMLKEKVEEAGLGAAFIKGHSLQIGGA